MELVIYWLLLQTGNHYQQFVRIEVTGGSMMSVLLVKCILDLKNYNFDFLNNHFLTTIYGFLTESGKQQVNFFVKFSDLRNFQKVS